MHEMSKVITKNQKRKHNFFGIIYNYTHGLNINRLFSFSFYTFAILLAKIHICTTNVKIIEIDDIKEYSSLQDIQDVYLLSMKTSSLIHSLKDKEFKGYLTSPLSTSIFRFSYPNEIFLEFDFFDEINIEKKEEVIIYIEKSDYRLFQYFIEILKKKECVMRVEPMVFFKFLKYLNIFRVKRNAEYKCFIKTLVFYSIMFNEEYFSRFSSDLCLFYQEYNNLHVRDVIECFFKFHLLKMIFIYEVFYKYNSMIFSMRNNLYKKYKKDKKFVSLQIEEFEFYFYNHLLNLKFYEIWIIIMKIFYIDKFYMDFYTFPKGLNLNIVTSSFPPNVRKISLAIQYKYLSLFDLLNEIEYFKSIKKLKLIFNCFTEHIVKIINYLKNLEKLAIIFREIGISEIYKLYCIPVLESIKYVKITSFKYFDRQPKTTSNLFMNMKENFHVDLNTQKDLLVPLSESDDFIKYNLYSYIIGINLRLYEQNYIPCNFEKIFNFESISRLKLDLKNVKDNCLNNYDFLESFESLKKLYFLNIKLTLELLYTLIKSNNLVFIWFKSFSFDEKINFEASTILNQSVTCMKFYDLDDCLNIHFFYFISKFMSLKYLSINLIFSYNVKRKNYGFEDKMIDMKISQIKKSVFLPRLCQLKYDNKIKCRKNSSFSVLHALTYFFDLESLEKLVYDSEILYQEDLLILENLKALKILKLYIRRKNLYDKLLEKILRSNIKETVFELHLSVQEFTRLEFVSIFKFKKLKFLNLRADFFDESDTKYVELLRGINLMKFKTNSGIRSDKYPLNLLTLE